MQLATGGSTLRTLKFDMEQPIPVHEATQTDFDPATFLAKAGLGRRIVEIKAKQVFFTQGSPADSVFYLQKGRAKITVVSERGKEATITLLTAGEFVGEESIAGAAGLRLATATAITSCKARLARILLLMAEFGKPGEPETTIPQITQETLAEMIGTTRSRVSFFMNRFRKMGFIEYKGRIQVHKSLLNVILHDQLPEQNAEKPPIMSAPKVEPRLGKIQCPECYKSIPWKFGSL